MKPTRSDERRHLIETAVQQADELMFALELDSQHQPRIIFANERAISTSGYPESELLGLLFEQFSGQQTNPILVDQLHRLPEFPQIRHEGLFYPKHGQPFYADWNLFQIQQPDERSCYWFAIIRDISIQRREQELRWQRQKIASLGTLAAGMAHDFNNLLAVILGNASMALGELPLNAPIREMITPIEIAARRAADLTRQMLTYAGEDRLISQSVNMNQLLQELCLALGPTFSHYTQLQLHLDPHIPQIIADQNQIKTALRNLILNASEAIGPARGTIRITTDLLDLDSAYIDSTYLAPNLAPGTHLRVVIHNSGPGIQADLLERIFEPFFTTKFVGRGLGLPEALGIVIAHRGTLKIESMPNQGTTCTLTLPVA